MDRCSSKRGARGLGTPRKAYTFACKDAATKEDQNAQFCNRIGCSGRIKYNQNAKIGTSDKSKYTARSSNGNDMTGKPSRSSSVTTSAKRSYLDSTRKLSSPSESSLSSESEHMSSPRSSSVSSDIRPQEIFRNKSSLHKQNAPPASSAPSASRSSALRPPNKSNGSTCGLRNLKCNSISDVVRPSCSSQESEPVGKNMMMKKRSSEGESSSSHRGRKTTTVSPSTSGISISDSTHSNTQRSMNVKTRMRISHQQNGRNSSSVRETALRISRNPDNEILVNFGGRRSMQQFSSSVSSSGSSSFSSSDGDNPSTATHLMNHDMLQRYNIDEIAEVLLALERIEQDEELTHEQVLALETSLFLSGFNFYDQHRDMRLDIDNMSYEELLALEERMGTVSTALPEEALSKCLTRRIYQATPPKVHITGSCEDGDDIKCSICQEEYVIGDEIGELVECQHGYHVQCINQWLRLKNWCPVCKASAAASRSSSSL